MEQTVKVAVYGVTGYTGLELLRALLLHPVFEVTALVSSSHAGKTLKEVFPFFGPTYLADFPLTEEPREEFELAFLCLPHEVSLELVPKLLEEGKRVVDLSAAYRLKDASLYPEYYGFTHPYPELLSQAVYGLPELYREQIKDARLVANPGCYPTAALLALAPLAKEGLLNEPPAVVGLSGVSGAGRKPRQEYHFPEMAQDFFPYAVEKHRHVPEMEQVLSELSGGALNLRFTPTVLPSSRGMVCIAHARIPKVELRELYEAFYDGEPFVSVVNEPPHAKWAAGTNHCFIYPHYDGRSSTAVVISAIDNLGKGASLQALQNANVMFNLDEDEGLYQTPCVP
ncbi:MAG: N-acetyl-gamma-glutamyl-phosphate reductase [Aquificae bacterium]|nr:N-acetyl-gamma-glutamyl-phosphate reductase [Aquificota bacterium]